MLSKAKSDFDKIFQDIFQFQSKLKIDIIDDTASYIVLADIPGVKKENVNIEYKDDILSIYVNEDSEMQNHIYIKKERQNGFFSRSFAIPNIDFENSKATLENGVLKITLPKCEIEVQSHSINIE